MLTEMKEVYAHLVAYVVALSKALNDDEFNKSLEVIYAAKK